MKDSAERLTSEYYPYASRRLPLVATRGVVATSKPLAAQAGLRMMLKGGNAVDAAIATAIALTVVEPGSNGIGADAFALIWDGSKLQGLNGSGRAPATHTPELFAKLGHAEMPARGWEPVTVPGAPGLWRDLHAKFGKLPFDQLFEPAIDYAENGHPVAPGQANAWNTAFNLFRGMGERPEMRGWFETFAPDGRAPRAGEIWRSAGHARTLRLIAESKSEAFYRGELAEKIAGWASETNGYITKDDLAAHTSTWVEPIGTSYRGYEVWEIPPNGQGITALNALNILEGFDLAKHPRDSVESFHLQIEAMKLAFADSKRYVADPTKVDVPVKGLLDKAYAAERRKLIGERALDPAPGEPPRGGTVYLCAADGDGLMVSFIQSNYQGFGSGVVPPGTGIALQNRGHGFTLQAGHPNQVAPGKRPYHTIIPAFMTQGGKAAGPFGVMGGFMQPQGHLQMVVNQVDYGMNPQTSLDAPRWQWMSGRQVTVEQATPGHVVHGLVARGHQVSIPSAIGGFGNGEIIRRLANGAYVVGSEPRTDGAAVGF